jgi:hypothetical protein
LRHPHARSNRVRIGLQIAPPFLDRVLVLAQGRVDIGENAARLVQRLVELERPRQLRARSRALARRRQRGPEQEVRLRPVGLHVDGGAQRLNGVLGPTLRQVELPDHEESARVGRLRRQHLLRDLLALRHLLRIALAVAELDQHLRLAQLRLEVVRRHLDRPLRCGERALEVALPAEVRGEHELGPRIFGSDDGGAHGQLVRLGVITLLPVHAGQLVDEVEWILGLLDAFLDRCDGLLEAIPQKVERAQHLVAPPDLHTFSQLERLEIGRLRLDIASLVRVLGVEGTQRQIGVEHRLHLGTAQEIRLGGCPIAATQVEVRELHQCGPALRIDLHPLLEGRQRLVGLLQ